MEPKGLNSAEFEALKKCFKESQEYEMEALVMACREHSVLAFEKANEDSIIDYSTAEDISDTFDKVYDVWDSFAEEEKAWLKAAMYYFALAEDDEPDFDSMIGFDDDARVLNACLILAGKDDWCLKIEDF